jgi:hypothetical protein
MDFAAFIIVGVSAHLEVSWLDEVISEQIQKKNQ